MRKLTRKQILARLFVGFFTLGSLLCTVNSAVAGGPSFGQYKINNSVWSTFDSEIKPDGSGNSVEVTVSGSSEGPTPSISGGYTESGDISSNSVKITTNEGVATKLSSVYGGNVGGTGSATQNIVDIASSTVNFVVYGGYVFATGNAASNSVHIASSTIGDVYGGYIRNKGSATQNIVDIASSTVNGSVYSGFTYNGNVLENKVNIASSTVTGDVYGGYAHGTGNAVSNSVHIASSTVDSVCGGYAEEGNAASNSVYISNSTINDVVWGAYVISGFVASNSVAIASSTVKGEVLGGNVVTGNAASNSVAIAGSTVTGDVYGGIVTGSSNNSALENKVTIAGSTVGSVYGGYIQAGTGSATQNIVAIASSTVNSEVYGGYTNNGNVLENKVNIASSTVDNKVYGGYIRNIGSATQNIVDIASSTINGDVLGGYVEKGSAVENRVDISSSTVNAVAGGWAVGASSATENKVDIASSTVNSSVYGGCVDGTGSATQNIVNITSGSKVTGIIFGGRVNNGDAEYNTVAISDDNTTTGMVYGGCVYGTGSATQNIVNITSGSTVGGIYGGIYGGYVGGNGNAIGNTVEISDKSKVISKVINGVYGGFTSNGNASKNTVKISGESTVECSGSSVYGGSVDSGGDGDATDNTVILSDSSKIGQDIYCGSVSGNGNATNNTVEISGGSTVSGWVFGGLINKDGDATKNTVKLSDTSTVSGSVYGGKVNGTGNGDATNNTVEISGGSTVNSEVYGGCVDGTGSATQNIVNIASSTVDNKVYGGYIRNIGSATQNKVNIASSTVKNNVYGGYTNNGNVLENKVNIASSTLSYPESSITNNFVYGGYTNNGDATQNIIDIASSTVKGVVLGGYTYNGNAASNSVHIASSTVGSVYGGYVGGNGNATDNTVEISGGSEVTGSVYGGDATGDARTDNKLIISGVGNKIGGSVENFESVCFKLASDDDTTKPMLTIRDSMDLDQIKLNSKLPEGGFNGERTLIDGNTLNYATATYTINGIAVDGDKSLTFAQKNDSSVNVGFYKYVLSESAIKLNAESTVAAVFHQTGKAPLSTDDRKIVVTSEMANNYSKIYGAFNADGGAATNATVELSEAVSNENLTIYGGYSTGSGVDVTTGNTLKVLKNGNKIKDILNFSNLDFSLDSDNSNNPTMLSLAADTVDLSKASINVNLANALAEGQTVTLLSAAQQLSLANDKLTINNEKLDSDLSLKIVDDSSKKYVNVADYSLNNASGKLSITANESFITSKYINGDKSKSVEKIDLTNDLSGFKNIYGSYSADNSVAEGGIISINEKVDLSQTTLIGGKATGNGTVGKNTLEIASSAAGSKAKGINSFSDINFTLGSDIAAGTTMLSTVDKVALGGASVNTEMSGIALAKGEKIVLLDNADKGNAELKLNGSTGDQTVAEENSSFVAVSSVGYNTDDNKIAIECKDAFAAGCYIDEKGKLGKDTLTLGSSAASNMRAGYERASEAPDMSGYKDIYGIYSAGSANPTGATIEIVSAIDYSNSVLHGGYKAAERAFYAEGNTLRVKSLNSKVKGVTDFETMEFDLPAETKSGDTMLKVTDEVDMAPTKSVGVEASKATGLKAGDSVNLIDSDVGIKNFGTQKITVSGLTDKTGEVKVDDKALVLDINDEKPNKNTKAPVEAVSATMALVNQASALASSKLNKSMTAAVASANGGSATFASMNGGHSKYETGSYVEADNWNIGFGLAKKGMSSKNPDSTYGLFFQYGKSNFDTHNDGGFRGDGDSKMFGAGLTFHQEARSKFYYHGNIYAGKVDAKWNCAEGGYDDKATYYGMTFGMGRKHNAGGNKTMDIYGRYSFNHVGSMNGDLNGLKYDFDSTSSHNLRLGLRMEYAKKNSATAYWGLAWEHEFAGASGATLTTPNIVERTASPSLKGDSGIAEVGYQWKRGNWEYNINAEGSFGKREGVTGSFNINYNF